MPNNSYSYPVTPFVYGKEGELKDFKLINLENVHGLSQEFIENLKALK